MLPLHRLWRVFIDLGKYVCESLSYEHVWTLYQGADTQLQPSLLCALDALLDTESSLSPRILALSLDLCHSLLSSPIHATAAARHLGNLLHHLPEKRETIIDAFCDNLLLPPPSLSLLWTSQCSTLAAFIRASGSVLPRANVLLQSWSTRDVLSLPYA